MPRMKYLCATCNAQVYDMKKHLATKGHKAKFEADRKRLFGKDYVRSD